MQTLILAETWVLIIRIQIPLIPETDVDWINVTVPTDTIFYSNGGDTVIKAPKYDIVNNSGRPVKTVLKVFPLIQVIQQCLEILT